jgi:hypothetical protein
MANTKDSANQRTIHPETLAGDPFAYASDRADARRKRVQAIRERTTRGLLLYNRERERIHRLEGDLWAVPSSQGGFWRVNLVDETCGCQDHRYQCSERDTGVVLVACKHVIAAAKARAKTQPAPGWVEDARRHYAPAYRAEITRLTALGVEPPEEDEA